MEPNPPLRVAVLWKQQSGYASACFRALADLGVQIYLAHPSAKADVPFDDARLHRGFPAHCWDNAPDEAFLRREIETFVPDALLVSSWDVGAYRRICRAMRGRTLRILCMDNPWMATPKQVGGTIVSPFVVRPAYDVAFLPGERQAVFARRLGFADDRMLWGLYTCDHDAFAAVADDSTQSDRSAFIFAGSLIARKGADTLAEAYLAYRGLVAQPWPLVVCGVGPLAQTLGAIKGVEMHGFVQPENLPKRFGGAGCLILPSIFEPWGVVIHEAAVAGLAIICTSACGASTRLVVDGYNGFVIAPGDAKALAAAMAETSNAPVAERAAVSQRSRELGRQFTPERWASYLTSNIVRLRADFGLEPA